MAANEPGRKHHPRGLPILFFTEMWERFSFYTMSSLLALYMDESLHFSHDHLRLVQGLYKLFVYLLPFLGGLLADRRLGFHRAVILGGVLMMLGHLTLAIESLPFFFTALVLLVLGSGLLKPNVSTILGELYTDRPELRDSGYNIFYMGINIGAMLGPISAGYLRHHLSWSVAFGSAALGMLLSLVVFIAGLRITGYRKGAAQEANLAASAEETPALTPAESAGRIIALVIVFVIAIIFWMAFYQYDFSMTFWVRDNVRTTMPPEWSQAIEPLYVIAFTPAIVWLWSLLRRKKREPRVPLKMALGMVMMAAGFLVAFAAGRLGGDTGRVSVGWIFGFYVFIALGEIFVSPMGLSLVSRVAPPGMRGMMMGGWFVSTGIGAYLSDGIGFLWYERPHSEYFLIMAAFEVLAAVLLLVFLRYLNRVIDQTV
jgi:proton-dependent oligopeptide transporter, POT family